VISTGANEIVKKYNIPYVTMVHCFLVYRNLRFDLTEGNCNVKIQPSISLFMRKKWILLSAGRMNICYLKEC